MNDIQEGNKLIAEFMDDMDLHAHPDKKQPPFWIRRQSGGLCPFVNIDAIDMKYHSSWDWLMPVVDNIEQNGKIVRIEGYVCEITSASNENPRLTPFNIHRHTNRKMESVFMAVVDFIKWYNAQNQQP